MKIRKILTIYYLINFKGDLTILNNSLYNLNNRLLNGYSPKILPVQNPNKVITVFIDFSLLQLQQMVIYI